MATPGTMKDIASRLLTPLDESEPEQPTDDDSTEVEEDSIPVLTDIEETEESEPLADEVEGEEPEVQTFEVNGEQKTLDELKAGHMMQADYTKKTMELAEQRREVEQKAEALQQALEQAEAAARVELEDISSPSALELKEMDPQEYYARKERVEEKQKQVQSLIEQSRQSAQEAQNARIAKEREMILPAIPEWVDQSVMQGDVVQMQNLWNSIGFTPDEQANFIDHRIMVLSRKAAKYDALMAAKPEGKKITDKPKSAEPKASTTREERTTTKRKELRDRVRKTGKMSDAQAAIRDLLKG